MCCICLWAPAAENDVNSRHREALAEEHVEHGSFPSAQKPEWQNHFQSGSVWRRLISFRRVTESCSRGKSQGLTLPRSILQAFRGIPLSSVDFVVRSQRTEQNAQIMDDVCSYSSDRKFLTFSSLFLLKTCRFSTRDLVHRFFRRLLIERSLFMLANFHAANEKCTISSWMWSC